MFNGVEDAEAIFTVTSSNNLTPLWSALIGSLAYLTSMLEPLTLYQILIIKPAMFVGVDIAQSA